MPLRLMPNKKSKRDVPKRKAAKKELLFEPWPEPETVAAVVQTPAIIPWIPPSRQTVTNQGGQHHLEVERLTPASSVPFWRWACNNKHTMIWMAPQVIICPKCQASRPLPPLATQAVNQQARPAGTTKQSPEPGGSNRRGESANTPRTATPACALLSLNLLPQLMEDQRPLFGLEAHPSDPKARIMFTPAVARAGFATVTSALSWDGWKSFSTSVDGSGRQVGLILWGGAGYQTMRDKGVPHLNRVLSHAQQMGRFRDGPHNLMEALNFWAADLTYTSSVYALHLQLDHVQALVDKLDDDATLENGPDLISTIDYEAVTVEDGSATTFTVDITVKPPAGKTMYTYAPSVVDIDLLVTWLAGLAKK